jgi:hypothetical protein
VNKPLVGVDTDLKHFLPASNPVKPPLMQTASETDYSASERRSLSDLGFTSNVKSHIFSGSKEVLMTQWSDRAMGRLYELYQQMLQDLRRDLMTANVELGSPSPEKVLLQPLTRNEFEAVLADPKRDQEAVSLWLARIIFGHEHEFPALQAAG